MYEYRSGIGQMPGKPHKLLYELYYYELARFESNYFEHVVCIIFHATSWPLDSMNSHARIQNTLQAHEILYNLYAKSMHQQHRKKKYVVVSVEEPDRRAQIAGFYLMRLPLKPKLCRSSAHFNASSLIRSHNKKSNANVKSASAQSECLWNMFTKIIPISTFGESNGFCELLHSVYIGRSVGFVWRLSKVVLFARTQALRFRLLLLPISGPLIFFGFSAVWAISIARVFVDNSVHGSSKSWPRVELHGSRLPSIFEFLEFVQHIAVDCT